MPIGMAGFGLFMSPNHRHLLNVWLRWALFALGMGVFGIFYIGKALNTSKSPAFSEMEERNLKLMEESVADIKPDFTHSFSEPLKRMIPHRTDGLAQPLWPWVAAWMHDDSDLAAVKKRAPRFLLGLTVGFLCFFGYTCARHFTLPAALLIVLISGLHGLLPTLSLFTGDTLFYLWFLLCWVACTFALQRNSLWVYGLSGTLGALAYLSEDRVLPLLIIFILISTLRAVWGWLQSHWTHDAGTSLWLWRNHFFGLILFASCFGFMAGSRLVHARAQFGQGFFSYMDQVRWLEDEKSAQAWILKHPNTASLKAMPLEERATPQIYLGAHSKAEMQERLHVGLHQQWQKLANDGGWHLAALSSLLFLLLGVAWCGTPRASHAGQKLHPETLSALFFTVAVSVTMTIIASWDNAVWPSDHLRALLAPLALSLIWACESVLRRARRRSSARIITYAYLTALWCMVCFDLVQHGKSFFQLSTTLP